jgi:uncharacterized membrane protein
MKPVLDLGPSLMPWPDQVRRIFPIAAGAAVSFVATVSISGVVAVAHTVRGRAVPTAALVGFGAGVLAAAGTAATYALRKRFLGPLFDEGRGLDPAHAVALENPHVSGSVGSAVPLSTHGREGARFVHSTTTSDDVIAVMGVGQHTTPIRIFIGYDAAPTIAGRVELAIAEMERTGAFDRGHLLVLAPAGTGFANSTPVDALEILAQGDCATVVVSYGLLPSFLSLDRTDTGAATQRALLEAIITRGYRGTLLLYGESLGARVQQMALSDREFSHWGIHRALWVGTPGGSDVQHQRSITIDHPEDIPHDHADIWLLEHHGDPVVRMKTDVILSRPEWLAEGERGRNIPQGMQWRPFLTFAQLLIDTVYATDVRPGDFQSFGHDYRGDLAAVTNAAFGFGYGPDHIRRLDERLRLLEKQRAARIGSNPSV